MPRSAREVIPGAPYHVCQPGNNKRGIFSEDEDRIHYLVCLNEKSRKYKLNILAYCLMNNHVHLIVIPEKTDSMSATFCVVNTVFARYYNEKYGRIGHFWNGRYYSVMLDENHLAIGARYVEKNPVRAGIVKKAEEWEWSSARHHILGEKGILKLDDIFKYTQLPKSKWKTYLNTEEDKKELYFIRKNNKT
jgi:putative transposase